MCLTPIHETDGIQLAILLLYSAGSTPLAAHILLSQYFKASISFWMLRNGVLLMVVAWGFVTIGIPPLVDDSVPGLLASSLLGVLAGCIASWGDRTLVRHMWRRQRLDARHNSNPLSNLTRPRLTIFGSSGPVPTARGPIGQTQVNLLRGRQAAERVGYSADVTLFALVTVAVLEEIIYRGFVVAVVQRFANPYLVGLALTASVLVFALSHAHFGWPHILGKCLLGALTMTVVLLCGVTMPAILAHLILNIRSWRDQARRLSSIVQGATGAFHKGANPDGKQH